MQPLEGKINNQITGVKDLNVRDRYSSCQSQKPANISRKQTKFETKLEVEKKNIYYRYKQE